MSMIWGHPGVTIARATPPNFYPLAQYDHLRVVAMCSFNVLDFGCVDLLISSGPVR